MFRYLLKGRDQLIQVSALDSLQRHKLGGLLANQMGEIMAVLAGTVEYR